MREHNKKICKISFTLIVIFIFIYLLYKWEFSRGLITVIFISYVISYFLKPAYNRLVNSGLNKRISALIMIVLVGILFILCFSIIIPMILRDGGNILETVGDMKANLEEMINKIPLLNKTNLLNNIMQKLSDIGTSLLDEVINGLMEYGQNAVMYLLIPILIYYFLADEDIIGNRILMLLPIGKRQLVKEVYDDIDKILSRYIISQLVLSVIIGILTFIILSILGIKYALILSIINGVFNIIPYFGPVFGGIPAVLSAVLISPRRALWTLVLLFVLQQSEGDIISPKIIGETVNMHPLTIMILLIIGGEIGGLLGMVLAVPLGVIIKVIYDDINYYLF
ncbi:MAG: AI-2E family transporter [Clostridium sp.]